MVVFGIDPGSTVTGWGVVRRDGSRLHLVGAGCIKTTSTTAMGERLTAIHAGLLAALRQHGPDAVAIEEIFRHKSSESALRLGQARGVALLAASQCGHEPVPYNTMTVKATVGAYGGADKAGVARMVGALLGQTPDGPWDVTDALAIAITHCLRARAPRLMAPANSRPIARSQR